MDLNLVSIFLSVMALTCLFMGAILYLQGGKSLSTKLFAMIAAIAGLWLIDMVLSFYQYTRAGHAVPPFTLTKASYSLAILIFYFLFLFAHSFPQDKLVIRKWLLVLTSLATGLVIIFSFIPNAILKYDEFVPGDYLEKAFRGPAYDFFFVPLMFFFLFWSIGKLLVTYRNTNDVLDKKKLRYIISGTLISGFLGITYDILSAYIPRNIGSLPVGHLGVFIFVSMSSYAILRYRLFNVKVIATELLTFSIWAFLLIRLFIAGDSLEIVVNGTLLLIVVIFGVMLIKSVLNEVHEREDLEKTSADLKYLESNLEQKIKEQTEEVKNAYEIEKKARIEIEEINNNKDKFILAAQHHLRTPLTIIGGYLSNLKVKQGLKKDELVLLSKMSESASKVSSSVSNLLKATEIKANKN